MISGVLNTILFLIMVTVSHGQEIQLRTVVTKDTFNISDSIPIKITLTNTSNKSIFIPATFSTSSNLMPNGVTQQSSGFNLHFDIQPISQWSAITIEGIVLITPKEFIKIRPGKSRTFIYDIGQHIQNINSSISDPEFRVAGNKSYTITTRFSNIWEYQKKGRSVLGEYKSESIKIYLRK